MLKVGTLICLFVSALELTEATTLRCSAKDIGLRLAHPRSCSLFWICSAEKKIVVRQCPKGLHFNERLEVCDLISRAGCTKEPISPLLSQCQTCDCSVCCAGCSTPANITKYEETEKVKVEIPSIQPEETGVTKNVVEEVQVPSIAVETTEEAEETLVVEERSTFSETPEEIEETQAVEETQEVVEEFQDPLISLETPTETEETQAVEESQTVEETQEVVEVFHYPSLSLETPEETEVNEVANEYVEEEPEIPSIISGIPAAENDNCDAPCCGQSNGATLSMPGNCRNYVICQNQRQTVMACPNNLYFNEDNGNCDFPENVNCKSPYTAPGPAAGPSGTHCNNGGRCISQPDGSLFADSSNARSANYVVCQCECEVPRSCSAPLMFNSKVQSCDWPENIASGDKPSNEDPSGDVPSGDVPSGDVPSGDVPSGDVPSGDVPSGDDPSGGTCSA